MKRKTKQAVKCLVQALLEEEDLDYAVQKLLEVRIIEMSALRTDMRIKISEKANELVYNLLKLAAVENSLSRKKWGKEVYAYCSSIVNWASKPEKPFNKTDLMNILCFDRSFKYSKSALEVDYKIKANSKHRDTVCLILATLCELMAKEDYDSLSKVINYSEF